MGPTVVVGAFGQLGTQLATAFGSDSIVLPRTALDIVDFTSVRSTIAETRPARVLNCAAYVDVDRCETPEGAEAAWRVNVDGVRHLAMACRHQGAQLVHFSTNYVFDGDGDGAYVESDLPRPRSVYAISKLAGEHAALAYAPGALIVRTAGLYGLASNRSKGGNFVERIVERAREHGEVGIVADQRLTPTSTVDLARAVVAAIDVRATGVLHLTNAGSCSWHEFACAALRLADLDVTVEPTTTVEAPGVATRPRNGVLATARARELGLAPLPPWQDALTAYMAAAGLAASPAGR